MSSLARSFEGFAPIFGQVTTAPSSGAPPPHNRRQFVFRARSLDALRFELIASDFASLTYRRIFTVDELEDMRDDVGLGGTWDEFVDYVDKSLRSDGVNLVLSDGLKTAKLNAHRSKGMPRITLSLNMVENSSAGDIVADLSVSLYNAYKDKDKDAIAAHDRCQQLTKLLSSEKENTEILQKQLDFYTFKSKRKVTKGRSSMRETSEASIADTQNNMDTLQSSELPSSHDSLTTKVSRRVVPVRRTKARGARLQDTEDNADT